MKTRTYYVHTIDNRPALYEKGRQIAFVGWRGFNLKDAAKSLSQIRNEQKASTKWRVAQGWSEMPYDLGYGYFIVKI